MKADRSVTVAGGPRRSLRLSIGLVAIALAASGALASAPAAHALPVPGPRVPCVHHTSGSAPAARRLPDTDSVSAAVRARVERQVRRTRQHLHELAGGRSSALPVFRVKVQIHVIHGSHRGEHRLKKRGARRKVFGILRSAYNGGESPVSEPMGVDFRLKRITVTKNDSWYHARMNSRADRRMKARLHRGKASTLNIYVNKPRPPRHLRGLLLGYSRFPWQYRGSKVLDGVTVNVRSLPMPGSKNGYNLGDSVVHETGHWLGLYHTFQTWTGAGCDPVNDGVADTPAEKEPYGNFGCSNPANICNPEDLVNGLSDPAYNFMEYTLDACMQMFTAGQHERAAAMFARFRHGR